MSKKMPLKVTKVGYIDRLTTLAAERRLSVGVHHVIVEHDDACRFHQTGTCTCQPRITICAGTA